MRKQQLRIELLLMNEQHLPFMERCNTQLQINKELLCSKEMLIEGLVNSKHVYETSESPAYVGCQKSKKQLVL